MCDTSCTYIDLCTDATDNKDTVNVCDPLDESPENSEPGTKVEICRKCYIESSKKIQRVRKSKDLWSFAYATTVVGGLVAAYNGNIVLALSGSATALMYTYAYDKTKSQEENLKAILGRK